MNALLKYKAAILNHAAYMYLNPSEQSNVNSFFITKHRLLFLLYITVSLCMHKFIFLVLKPEKQMAKLVISEVPMWAMSHLTNVSKLCNGNKAHALV